MFLARILQVTLVAFVVRLSEPHIPALQYLETPQYLRKVLFPMHPDLKNVGITAPTDMPHHLRVDEWCNFREGVVLKRPTKAGQSVSWANVGLAKDVCIDTCIQPGVRVTVEIEEATKDMKQMRGQAVPPSAPRNKRGIYWGYQVRLASNLEKVWSECPFEGGYDFSLGTSQHGHNIIEVTMPNHPPS